MEKHFINTLKKRAHHLKPVIIIGANGISQAVLDEADIALNAHELIKVKINGADKESRKSMGQTFCQELNAKCITQIGSIMVVYRKNERL
jgi:RNA-binding protein